jgi:hypothetical protein
MKVRSVLLGGLVVGLLGAATPASAALITGSFAVSGSATYDTLNTTGGAGLDFNITLPPPTTPTGPFIQVTVATDYFAGLGMTPFVTTGEIKNITNVFPVTDPDYTYAPAGVAIFVSNFLTNFSGGAAGLHFDLTGIPLQPGPGCPATPSCAEGPFILTETATGIRIDFDVLGTFVNGADSGEYIGSFGITINGLTLAEAGNRLTVTGADIACGANNSTQPCSFTANFNPAAVPEPATMLTFGLGSLVLARMRRRKA